MGLSVSQELRRLAVAIGDGWPWRRGRREEGDGDLISRALKVEGLKCKKTNVLPRDMFSGTEEYMVNIFSIQI